LSTNPTTNHPPGFREGCTQVIDKADGGHHQDEVRAIRRQGKVFGDPGDDLDALLPRLEGHLL
jgi:hypothetical protein